MTHSFMALDAFRPALHHTWNQLFQPFRPGLWARLALVGILTGDMPGCGGGGGGSSAGRSSQGDQFLSLPADPLTLSLLIFLGVLGAILLVLFLGYVSGVFRFILFDAVATDRYRLIPGWKRFRERGFSFFLWQLVFLAAMLVALVIVVGIPALLALVAGVFGNRGPGLVLTVLLGLWAGVGLLAVVTAGMLVWVLARDFVVPIMALEEVGALEGWKRFLPLLSARKLNYLIYLILRFVLAVVALLFFGILALLMVLVLFLVVGAAGLTLFLGGLWAQWTWNPYTIALVVVFGGGALLIVFYAIAFLCTPAVAFFPTYAAHFLSLQYPRLAETLARHPSLLDSPPAEVAWSPNPPPPGPPPPPHRPV